MNIPRAPAEGPYEISFLITSSDGRRFGTKQVGVPEEMLVQVTKLAAEAVCRALQEQEGRRRTRAFQIHEMQELPIMEY